MTDKKRTFNFETTFDTPIPDTINNSAARGSKLPFRDWFNDNVAAAVAGGQPHLFIPKAYWVEERGANPEKTTLAAQRAKIRTQFKEWQATLKDNTAEADMVLLVVNREEGHEKFKEEGVSIWLTPPRK